MNLGMNLGPTSSLVVSLLPSLWTNPSLWYHTFLLLNESLKVLCWPNPSSTSSSFCHLQIPYYNGQRRTIEPGNWVVGFGWWLPLAVFPQLVCDFLYSFANAIHTNCAFAKEKMSLHKCLKLTRSGLELSLIVGVGLSEGVALHWSIMRDVGLSGMPLAMRVQIMWE